MGEAVGVAGSSRVGRGEATKVSVGRDGAGVSVGSGANTEGFSVPPIGNNVAVAMGRVGMSVEVRVGLPAVEGTLALFISTKNTTPISITTPKSRMTPNCLIVSHGERLFWRVGASVHSTIWSEGGMRLPSGA